MSSVTMGVEVEVNNDNTSFAIEMDDDKISNVAGKLEESSKTTVRAKEAENLVTSNVPKDAVVDWPAPKQVHTFYFIKFRSYDDPKIRAKIEQAEKDLQRKNLSRSQIVDSLKAKRLERSNLKSQMQPFYAEKKKYQEAIDEKMMEIQPLREDLDKLRNVRVMGLCSSEEELNDLIKSLHYRIQHESNTLNEEKKLLKEIKQLEATRDKVIAHAAVRGEIEGAKGQRTAIQDRVKQLGGNMGEAMKEKKVIGASLKQFNDELKVVDSEIKSLEEELKSATERRDKAYEAVTSLRKARDEMNACYYQNRSLINNANELAVKKDTSALEALSNSEVEKFMSKWNNSKVFRDDYEKRIWTSLNYKQLSKDGRMRNPDEKPIVIETPQANNAKVEILPAKSVPKKHVKETVKPPPSQDAVPIVVNKIEEAKKSIKADAKENGSIVEEDIGKSQEAPKPELIDPEKLKERKREEEIAKNKLAMERKKKAAEKAAAKAAAKAQKEAEKKLMKEEKKAKKKAGITEADTQAEETEMNASVPEKEADAKSDEGSIPAGSNEQKVSARYRKLAQPKVKNQLPRSILKKKKSQSYMYWVIPAVVLALVLVLLLGLYTYGKI